MRFFGQGEGKDSRQWERVGEPKIQIASSVQCTSTHVRIPAAAAAKVSLLVVYHLPQLSGTCVQQANQPMQNALAANQTYHCLACCRLLLVPGGPLLVPEGPLPQRCPFQLGKLLVVAQLYWLRRIACLSLL